MKHIEIERLLFKRALIKPIACLTLALSALLVAPMASATVMTSPGNDLVWCNGDGAGYKVNPYFPADTLPFGYISSYPNHGANPVDTWDKWMTKPFTLGDKLETDAPYLYPAMAHDVYAVQLNYWNSIINSNPAFNILGYDRQQLTQFGHSSGSSCLTYTDSTNNTTPNTTFTISYPASASTPDTRPIVGEVDFHKLFPLFYPTFVPYYDPKNSNGAPTAGAPTGYVSTFKGCSWDGSSCTAGSSIPTGMIPGTMLPTLPVKSSDINVFPERLSDITSIPTSWTIAFNSNYGNPDNDPSLLGYNTVPQNWDASWDIWFDKTAHTAEGEAPYNQASGAHDARGQNDGLEIMVWMNSKGSYVDATNGGLPVVNQPGLIQPTGHIREQALIEGTLYDVWVGRLNNPYFGYVTGSQLPDGTTAPGIIKPTQVPGNCPTTFGQDITTPAGRKAAILCGVEWNVVSFVATKQNQSVYINAGAYFDHRKTANSFNAKAFTDYLLGIQRPYRAPSDPGSWLIEMTDYGNGKGLVDNTGLNNAPPRRQLNTPLQCPKSNKDQSLSGGDFGTSPCLDPSWFLMSVQAGFETWSGGNGLSSKNFTAYVNTAPTVANTGIVNAQGYPIVSNKLVDLVYGECKPTANSHAYFSISGKNAAQVSVTYPASGTIDMGPQRVDGRFDAFILDPAFTIVGEGVINFTSTCGGTLAEHAIFTTTAVTPGVTVALTLNGQDWPNGYCRNVVVKNTNNYSVTWNVNFALPFAGTIDPKNTWNLTYSQTGNNVSASGLGWNNILAPGQTYTQEGFCASK